MKSITTLREAKGRPRLYGGEGTSCRGECWLLGNCC